MKIKTKMLQEYLGENKMTVEELAKEMKIDIAELIKLLNGEEVGVEPAKQFIYYFGADKAQHFIDWNAIGKKNPLVNEVDLLDSEND